MYQLALMIPSSPLWNSYIYKDKIVKMENHEILTYSVLSSSLIRTQLISKKELELTRFVVVDISKQEEDDTEGGQSGPPGKHKHQHHRDNCPEQCCPFTVVVKRWPPT